MMDQKRYSQGTTNKKMGHGEKNERERKEREEVEDERRFISEKREKREKTGF